MFWRTWFGIGLVTCGLTSIFAAKAIAEEGSEWASRPLWTTVSDAADTLESDREKSWPCDGCSCTPGCHSRWTISADALILDRVMNSTRSVGALSATDIITGESFDFAAATGPRISAIYQWDDELAAEINYLGIHGWHAEIYKSSGGMTIHAPGNFGSIFLTGGWDYGSRIDSAEFNLRWSPADRVTWIGGFRYVEWAELLRLRVNPPYNNYNYDAVTNNQLYGAQIGLDCLWWDRGGPMQWNTVIKAGGYSNTAYVHNGFLDPDKGNKTAFLGEIATIGHYALSDTWALRGGYQLMWLSGIAVAPDQLRVPIFEPADLSGGVFLHGAIVGIEATW